MSLLDYVADLLRRVAGTAAAMLPNRWWPRIDPYVPASDSAFIAGLLTFLTGALIGIQGFLSYAAEQASLNNRLLLEAATRPDAGEITSAGPVAVSALALFNFLLLTPEGWAASYLSLTGLVRTAGATFDDPRGDLILAIVDGAWLRLSGAAVTGHTRRQREALEGPEVRDRVVAGASVGCPGADLVIVASRRKEGWDAGTVVLTGSASYRVGTIVERTIAGRLRTLYPLSAHHDLEVFRRTVRYELPPD